MQKLKKGKFAVWTPEIKRLARKVKKIIERHERELQKETLNNLSKLK